MPFGKDNSPVVSNSPEALSGFQAKQMCVP